MPPRRPSQPPPPYEEASSRRRPHPGRRHQGRPAGVAGRPVALPARWPPRPVEVICPSCGAHVFTATYSQYSDAAHVAACILCLFGCWLCCLLPYCIGSCQSTHHYCPACYTYLGTCDSYRMSYQPPPPLHEGMQPAYGVGGPSMSSPQTAVVFTSVVPARPAVGPDPCLVQCPTCGKHVQTEVRVKAGTRTHLIALLLCIVGCWPCCCIPYCVDSCRAKNHYCPECNTFLGTFE